MFSRAEEPTRLEQLHFRRERRSFESAAVRAGGMRVLYPLDVHQNRQHRHGRHPIHPVLSEYWCDIPTHGVHHAMHHPLVLNCRGTFDRIHI